MRKRTTIRLALRTRLLTVTGLPAARLFEGTRAKRPAPSLPLAPYVREAFLPGPTRVEGHPAQEGRETVDGVYLVDLFYPADDAGLTAGEAMAALVTRAFSPGYPNGVLATGDATVSVQALGASSARTLADDPWLQLPCTIRWRSQTPNT